MVGDSAKCSRERTAFDRLIDLSLRIAAGLLILVVGYNFLAAYGPPVWRPAIRCQAPTWDAGNLIDQPSIEHVFVLQSTGGRALTISEIKTDCRCTKFSSRRFPYTIPSGESLEIHVRVNLVGLSGFFEKRVIVSSDDPLLPRFELVIKGKIDASQARISERRDWGFCVVSVARVDVA